MIETFAALFFAHTLADFVFQTRWMVDHKKSPLVLLLHSSVVWVTAIAAVGQPLAWELLVIGAAHMAVDAVKTYLFPDGIVPFIGDQVAHFTTLVVIVLISPDLFARGPWAELDILPTAMALFAGLVMTVRGGRFAVAILLIPHCGPHLPDRMGENGALIGVLERVAIFGFILIGQPAGLLLPLLFKAALRYRPAAGDRQLGQYIVIGTAASFGWAVAWSLATVALLDALPPLGFGIVSP